MLLLSAETEVVRSSLEEMYIYDKEEDYHIFFKQIRGLQCITIFKLVIGHKTVKISKHFLKGKGSKYNIV